MGKQFGYKKYMKKDAQKDSPLWQVFVVSFFGMLLIFTFLIKSFSPAVDTSIGEYVQDADSFEETIKIVDDRLSAIQREDSEKSFSDIMAEASDIKHETADTVQEKTSKSTVETPEVPEAMPEPVYKVFIGSYSSAEQAKVAKEIIRESGSGFDPIVKCIGMNSYALQAGIFKSRQSAESLLYTIRQNNLPGRIVQE